MAHLRKRYINTLIGQAQNLSPLIGLLGHRQVGKTTVLEKLCKNYCTLDDQDLLKMAQTEPKVFLKHYNTFLQGIDECQLAPSLFPALKEHIRLNKRPGQYLISGSVRFTSRQAIRESLTGRIINFELLPLTVSEMAHQELPKTIFTMMSTKNVLAVLQSLQSRMNLVSKLAKELRYYFNHGGLPGVCFIQNDNLRNLRIKEQLQTILDRDIRLVYPTTLPYSQILDFLKYIAFNQGQNFSYAEAKKQTGISPITQKKLLYALEAVFLIRRLTLEGSVKSSIYYLEDQAESQFLTDYILPPNQQFEQLMYRNIRAQVYYSTGLLFREFQFQTRSGVKIPYAIEQNNFILGFLPIESDYPNRQEKSMAASFLKKYEKSRLFFLHGEKKLVDVDSRSISAPIHLFI